MANKKKEEAKKEEVAEEIVKEVKIEAIENFVLNGKYIPRGTKSILTEETKEYFKLGFFKEI